MRKIIIVALAMIIGCGVALAHENLSRSLIAMPKDGGQVFLGWRLLLKDADATAFNVYRSQVSGKDYALISQAPVSDSTNYIDETSKAGETYYYVVKALNNGQEGPASNEAKVTAAAAGSNVIHMPVNTKGGIEKVMLADLNGDGLLDFIVTSPNKNKDPSEGSGVWSETNRNSDTIKVSAYLNDGTFLWTVDLGWGVELGVHYCPMVAWDIDGNGKADVILKTVKSDNPLDYDKEYLTVLDGMTGKVKNETRWIAPVFTAFHEKTGVWTPQEYGENSRNYIGIAYLDGTHPFIIVGRGTYGVDHPTSNTFLREDKYAEMFPTSMIAVAAFDTKLNKCWEKRFSKYDGRATHGFDVGDLEGNGKDQILWGEMFLESNGNKKWSGPRVPYVGHPDYAIIAPIIPSLPGLQVFIAREGHLQPRSDYRIGTMVLDKDGKTIWAEWNAMHVHWGMIGKFSDKYAGLQITTRDSAHTKEGPSRTYMANGALINLSFVSATPVRWERDTKDLLYEKGVIRDYDTGAQTIIGDNGPVKVVGDIVGDSREEMVGVAKDGKSVYIVTNTDKSATRKVSPLYDRMYREGISRTGMEYTRDRDAFVGGYGFVDAMTDDRLPELQILSHKTGDAINGLAVLSGTADSGQAITGVACFVDGKERGTGKVDNAAHTWALELNTKELPEGMAAVEVQVTDAKNYKASTFRQLVVSNFKRPVPSVSNPVEGAELTGKAVLSGRVEAEAGAACVETFLDTMLTSGLDVNDGAWKWECDTTTLSDGPHVLRVIAYDKAGQYGYKDVPFTVSNKGHEYVVYGDILANGWDDRSYDADGGGGGSLYNFRNKTPVHSGQTSIACQEIWAQQRGIYLFSNTPVNINAYNFLEFYVYGRKGARPGALIKLLDPQERVIDKIDLRDEFPEGVWTKVSVPLDKFKIVKDGLFSGIYIQSYSNSPEGTFFVDDISLK